MVRQALLWTIAAALAALASGGPVQAARAEVLTVVVPGGPTVTSSTQLRVGRRYKLVFRGTGASKVGSPPNLDFFFCFGSNCSGGAGTRVNLVNFCGQQGSGFQTGTGRLDYRDDHVYELTVERTFDTPTDAPGFDVPGKLLFKTMAGDYLGECRRPEKDPGDLQVDPDDFALEYVENGRALRGPGGTFTIEITDVGSIARPPTSTTGTKTPSKPTRPSTSTSGLNVAVVGHHYSVGATGSHSTIHRGRLRSATGTYAVSSARIHMSSAFTYSGTRRGDAAAGTAVVTLVLVRQRGTGPRAVSLPMTYRLGTAAKWTPDRAAREWRLSGTLVRPRVPGCENAWFFVGALRTAYISFSACGLQVTLRPATVSIR